MRGQVVTEPTVFAEEIAPPEIYAKRLRNGIYAITELGLERRCSKCDQYWPADNQFFFTSKTPDGLHRWCKGCYLEWLHAKRRRGACVIAIATMSR